jgi:hypothetical protein
MKRRTWATIRRDKAVARRQSAARPFAEKLEALDRLTVRTRVLRTEKPTRDPA